MSHPGFFKFFMPEDSSEPLTLPQGFTKCIKGRFPKLVVLTDGNTNFWRVRVERIQGDTCFQDGWPTFLGDTLVKEGDLLVFEYYCKGMFKVKLFDVYAREKKLSEKFIFKGIGWKENRVEENEHVKKEMTDEDYDVELEVENSIELVEVKEEENIDYKDVDEEEDQEDEDVEEGCARVEKDGGDTNGKRHQKRRIRDLGEDAISKKNLRRRRITNNSQSENGPVTAGRPSRLKSAPAWAKDYFN